MAKLTFEEFIKEVLKVGGEVIGIPAEWHNVEAIFKSNCGTTFYFHSTSKIKNLSIIDYGGNNRISIGEKSKLQGMLKIGKGCQVLFGNNITITGNLSMHISDATSLKIEDDCMMGVDIKIYTHDYHPIFDKDTGCRVNYSQDIVIKNHVWIGNSAMIFKGVTIEQGSVIAANSVVTKNVDAYTIAAGNPAKIVKNNIVWTRDSFNTTHLDGIMNIQESKAVK